MSEKYNQNSVLILFRKYKYYLLSSILLIVIVYIFYTIILLYKIVDDFSISDENYNVQSVEILNNRDTQIEKPKSKTKLIIVDEDVNNVEKMVGEPSIDEEAFDNEEVINEVTNKGVKLFQRGNSIAEFEIPEFDFINKLPQNSVNMLNIQYEKMRVSNTAGEVNFSIVGQYNYLSTSGLSEDELSEDELRLDIFNALMFHALLACWSESDCVNTMSLLWTPASIISATDKLAWLSASFIIHSLEHAKGKHMYYDHDFNSELTRLKLAINDAYSKATLKERIIVDYKKDTIIYYMQNSGSDFNEFLGDYWFH